MHLGISEILLLIFLALVLFGGSKLGGVGKALGRSIKEFRDELKDKPAEGEDAKA
ncbi:MAG: twin-arginine translocase TatA/TatE family subunit [Synergistaceae bacterium]|nr:twin-arginine translocase TatA/TatE family subunit [Synergistaceae bacterium]